ncbi:MAG: PAS domain-containing protein [Fibromonadaceae bacterium]|jgi:PAS domain S-box-containing protein|nr:PAS domain-containing protein [Fibromonadaceae bacterium]
MTIDENINEAEDAVCIANNSGRILTANKRFCKMFGFDQSEVKGHYLCDLYRHKEVLSRILENIPEQDDVLQTRMRTRAGRSFPCLLTYRGTKSLEGIPLLRHSIQRSSCQ